jgi:hypothetical protein
MSNEHFKKGLKGFLPTLTPFGVPQLASVLVAAVSFVAMTAFLFYMSGGSAEVNERRVELEREFTSIRPLPGAEGFDYLSTNKESHALVTEKYQTKATLEEIRAHYQAELSAHGWQFAKEKKLYDWGRDFGGETIYFRKGDYAAALEYEGDDTASGYTYALSLSWGLKDF